MSTKFQEAAQLRAKYHEVLFSIDEGDVLALFQPLLQQFPQLIGVGWYQYIPAFNDGDPCVFHMGDFYPIMQAADGDEQLSDQDVHRISGRSLESESDDDAFQAVEGLSDAFYQTIGYISEDISERIFGDNTCIIVSKEQITTKDYSCGH
jgi:hypothetical protein